MDRVGVTIPTYNQEPERLMAAVASCISAGAHVVAIHDDGSDANMVASGVFQVLVSRDEHRGVPYAFNSALRTVLDKTSSAWVARFSSDDQMDLLKLHRQIDFAHRHAFNAVFHDCRDSRAKVDLGGKYDTGMPKRRDWPDINRGRWRNRLKTANRFAGTTSIVRADYMRKYLEEGGHPESLPYCHDWWLNCWVEHEVPGGWGYLPEVLSTIGRYDTGLEAKGHSDPVAKECRERCQRMIRERWG